MSGGTAAPNLVQSVDFIQFADAALQFLDRMAQELRLPIKKIEVGLAVIAAKLHIVVEKKNQHNITKY